MDKRSSRSRMARNLVVEGLDRRIVLSTLATAPGGAVEVAAQGLHKAATTTTLAVSSGTLGQPVTFTVTVRAPASAGSPSGTVNIVDHGAIILSLPLSPATSTSSKYAESQATYTLTQTPGGSAYYFGKHAVSASFAPDGAFGKSTASKSFTVVQPDYTKLADGTKVATITPGTGSAIASGQTANVLYTGYLEKNGKIFDDSIEDGGTPLSFEVGVGQVVPGFDAGTSGMQAGESRVILIPPADGYGKTTNGAIPATRP